LHRSRSVMYKLILINCIFNNHRLVKMGIDTHWENCLAQFQRLATIRLCVGAG
jgi:hypothetical protein